MVEMGVREGFLSMCVGGGRDQNILNISEIV